MKNLYSKNEFLTLQKEDEMLNEGWIGKMFKGLWNNVMKLSNKVKGSKEINTVYDKYKKSVDDIFSKIGSAEVASAAVGTLTPTSTTPTTANASFNYNGNDILLNEDATLPFTGTTATPDQQQQVKKKSSAEEKNLVNLTPEKIAKVAKITEERVNQLKKQFEGEVDAIVKRLSKNPEYSSDKLNAYSIVMKNQFNTYCFDQWWGIYQKAGDQKKITELTKVKKENELKFKQAIDALNTKLGEKQQQQVIESGKKYTYYSETNKKDIEVTVFGKAIGQDENGTPDTTDPDHKNMWKVKTDSNNTFWIPASSFKAEIAPATPPAAAPSAAATPSAATTPPVTKKATV